MSIKDPFKTIIPEYVLIFIVLGFTLWLALGSITEFAIPLDSLKKISGTVTHVEHKASNCRLYDEKYTAVPGKTRYDR